MANVDTVVAALETEDVAVAQPEIAVVIESVEKEMKMETVSSETQPALIADEETKASEASVVANDSNDGNTVSIEVATVPELCDTAAAPNNTPVKPSVEAAESEPMADETCGKTAEKSDSTEEAEMKNPETDGEASECEGKTTAEEPVIDATASVGEESTTAASNAAA